jgi:hypothetical protein
MKAPTGPTGGTMSSLVDTMWISLAAVVALLALAAASGLGLEDRARRRTRGGARSGDSRGVPATPAPALVPVRLDAGRRSRH